MKIKLIDSSTKKPLINTQVQIQVKGQNGGNLTLTTDTTGMVEIEDKYEGQQISATLGKGGHGQTMVTANENAVLLVDPATTRA